MVNVALIGYGYWGNNLLRNLNSLNGCNVLSVCDFSDKQLEKVNKLYPNIPTTKNLEDIWFNKDIDAIIIATPVSTHFNLAKQALLCNKHVLVEKPITSTVEEAEELVELASSKNLQLMVDHTFLYTSAVETIKQLIEEGTLGNIKYIDSTRINLGLIQQDVNVLWDLAPHDLAILNYLIGEQPYSVNATGICHTGNNHENIAYMTLKYKSGFMAHFNCSWSSPVKIRTMLIGGDKKMVVYDDIQPTEKVKVYDTGHDIKSKDDLDKMLIEYRTGDIYIPKINMQEALGKMLQDFLYCIENDTLPRSNWSIGLQTIKILEAANKSLKQNGKQIIL